MQADADVQETLSKRAHSDPSGLAGVLIVQVVPDRASVKAFVLPVPASHSPTATHDVADTQESPSRWLPLSLGLGSSCWVHVLPSHRTTIIAVVLIAAQAVDELQVTDLRPPSAAGGVCSDHALPSHRTMYRCSDLVILSLYSPTAVHADSELHDTLLSGPGSVASAGSGAS